MKPVIASRSVNCLVTTLLCLSSTVVTFAQADRATLTGTVSDPSHAAISGAKIAISDVATGVEHATSTNSTGVYTISSLAVGDYTVTVTAQGFNTLRFKKVTLEVGETRTLNPALAVSGVDTQVSVVDAAADLDQSSAQIGSVIKGSQTQDLPINGRSWARLLTLVPGAIDGGSGTEDQVRFAGLSQEDNNFHFDGVDATGINHQFEKVDLRLQLSTEAIAEFRVNSALFSADQGGSAGGQVEIVSRSGTNRFQGSAWEFFRNSVFDARPWGSGALPRFELNNYGANFGGAIIKNKFFFFTNWESLRQILDQPLSGLVPTAAYRALAVSINPALAPIMNAYPLGAITTKDPNALSWIGSGRNTIGEDSGMFRLDYNLSSSTLVFLRFGTDHYAATFPNGAQVAANGTILPASNSLNTPNAVLDLQHTFSPRILNDTRVGFNRADYLEGGSTSLPYGVSIQGFSTLSLPAASNRDDNSISFVDDATFVAGRHTIKAGVTTRRVQENKASPNVNQGAYTWNSETAFLSPNTNLLNSYTFNGLVPVTGQRMTEVSGYVLDEFKPLSNLTFNIGLRYDYFGVDHEVEGRGIVVDPVTCPNVICPAGSSWYNPNTKNFEPRVSVAWSPKMLHGKTVIRTGWGIFDGIGQFGHLGGPIGNVTAKYTLNQTTAPGLTFPITPFLNNVQFSASYSGQDRNRKDLSLNEWSLSIQHELARDTTL